MQRAPLTPSPDRAATANDRADAVQQFATEQIALLQAAHAAAMQAAKASADATLEAVKRAHAAEIHALRAVHAVTLQVTTDRIDQLERRIYGPRGGKRPKTPDGQREARKRSRAGLAGHAVESLDLQGAVPASLVRTAGPLSKARTTGG